MSDRPNEACPTCIVNGRVNCPTHRPVEAPAETPTAACPKCGAEQEDHDGFGVLRCEKCGYCTHASIDGGKCGLCGERPAETQRATLRKDALRALGCLYIAVEKDVADDVNKAVRAYIATLEPSPDTRVDAESECAACVIDFNHHGGCHLNDAARHVEVLRCRIAKGPCSCGAHISPVAAPPVSAPESLDTLIAGITDENRHPEAVVSAPESARWIADPLIDEIVELCAFCGVDSPLPCNEHRAMFDAYAKRAPESAERDGWPGEWCKRCQRRNNVAWSVSDELWTRVVAGRWNVVCPTCFDEEAQRASMPYSFGDSMLVSWSDWCSAQPAPESAEEDERAFTQWFDSQGYLPNMRGDMARKDARDGWNAHATYARGKGR